jgi:hypothetical protein
LTDEIAQELYLARKELNSSGVRTDLVPNGTRLTWEKYLDACGLARTTVHNWLEHFEPEEQRLLTDDEYQKKQEEKKRIAMSIKDANASRVSEAIKTGAFPSGWNNECQILYNQRIKEGKLRDERIKKNKEYMDTKSEERGKAAERLEASSKEINKLINHLKALKRRLILKEFE